MNDLILIVERLKKEPIKQIIDLRMKEFEELGNKNSNEIFKELCFCFMTANFNAEGGIRIQKEIGDEFLYLSEQELAEKLKDLGHRFPNARAKYITGSRKHKDNIKEILNSFQNEEEARTWIVDSIKGIGMKEASHFLRNIGYKNLAIIDFHIVNLLSRSGVIEKPKILTVKRYLEIENLLKELAQKTNTNPGELDLYLWYEETGKVLK